MADFDPKITKLLEERCVGYASEKTAAKEIAEITGLNLDVARAFSRGWSALAAPRSQGIQKR